MMGCISKLVAFACGLCATHSCAFAASVNTVASSPAAQPGLVDVLSADREVGATGVASVQQLPLQAQAMLAHGNVSVHGGPRRISRTDPRGIRQSAGRMRLQLFPDVTVTAVKDDVQTVGGNIVWAGTVEGGRPEERVSLVTGPDGSVYGQTVVRQPDGSVRVFEMLPVEGNPTASIVHEAPLPNYPDGMPLVTKKPTGTARMQASKRRRRQSAEVGQDSGGTVDVMVLYTSNVVKSYGVAGTEAKIASAVADANKAYINSQVSISLNLVHRQLVDYNETGNMMDALNRATNPSDGFIDNLKALRDQYKADLVQLVVDDYNYCGIGWLMSNWDVGDPTGFEYYGISVVSMYCLGSLTPAHEWGHNMGLHHDRDSSGGSEGAYPYSYGYRECGTQGGIQTVMAYWCDGVSRIPYFSNPDIKVYNRPTGISSSVDPANSAENARTLRQTAWTIANLRVSGQQRTPPTPAFLKASATGATQIVLSWNKVVEETGYKVYRVISGGTDQLVSGSVPVGGSTVTFTDSGLNASTAYTYRVTAFNTVGESTKSLTASATTYAPEGMVPAAPIVSGLALVGGKVVFNLAANTNTGGYPLSFTIYRAVNGGQFTLQATIDLAGALTASHENTDVASGHEYQYKVMAVNTAGASPYSPIARVAYPFPSPSIPTATVLGPTSIRLVWDAVDGAPQYSLVRVPLSGGARYAGGQVTLTSTSTTYDMTGLEPGSTYELRVAASSSASTLVTSAPSVVQATTQPLIAPTNVKCTATSITAVNVQWTAVSGAVFYSVQRVGGLVANTANGATSFAVGGLAPSTQYTFQVVAKTRFSSSTTATCTCTTMALAKSKVSLSTATNSQINLKWNAVSGAQGYRIIRGTLSIKSTPITLSLAGANTLTYSDTRSVVPGARYSYVVVPYYGTATGPSSDTLYITVPPIQPAVTFILTRIASPRQARIQWLLPSGVSTNGLQFRVWRQGPTDQSFLKVATLGASVRLWSDTRTVTGKTYKYRVDYVNVVGTSNPSMIRSVTMW